MWNLPLLKIYIQIAFTITIKMKIAYANLPIMYDL